jgi:gliding motility-associated-like protein
LYDGSATVYVSGGAAPYSFDWGEPTYETSYVLEYMYGGDFLITVSDANGCFAEITVTIEEPVALAVTESHADAACFGGQGEFTLTATGGTAPYTYRENDISEIPSQGSLYAGDYFMTVTDARGCWAYTDFTISQPEELTATAWEFEPVSCAYGMDGTAVVTALGGVQPYLYNGSSSTILKNLNGGEQWVVVTDAHACETVVNFIMEEPQELLASVASLTDVTCYGGSNGTVTLQATGGTEPYQYDFSSSPVITGLTSGYYFFTVEDARGCYVWLDAVISENQTFAATVVASTDVTCYGREDGTVTLLASGGVEPYLYASDYPSYDPSPSPVIGGLNPGYHIFTVTDAEGCVTNADYEIYSVMDVFVTINHFDATCDNSDGILNADATDGTPGYTYLWSPGGWTTASVENVSPGTYTVVVSDVNGCEATSTEIVESSPCEDFTLVPTAITANGDGENDTFRVLTNDVGSIQLNVYDMFGQSVFSTTDVTTATESGWDGTHEGKQVPSGWYIWTLQGTHANGRPLTSEGGQRGRLVLSRP